MSIFIYYTTFCRSCQVFFYKFTKKNKTPQRSSYIYTVSPSVRPCMAFLALVYIHYSPPPKKPPERRIFYVICKLFLYKKIPRTFRGKIVYFLSVVYSIINFFVLLKSCQPVAACTATANRYILFSVTVSPFLNGKSYRKPIESNHFFAFNSLYL